jgi:exodeoxyribonuclease V alpha subunit
MTIEKHKPSDAASEVGNPVVVEKVAGSVVSLVFRNDETGYTVCTIRPSTPKGEVFTLVGSCAAVWEGEEITADGSWIRHPQHGKQFQAASILCVTPTSAEGIRRYLGSGMIRGVGKELAKRIVDHFGDTTLQVIEKESRRLEEVEGIGKHRRNQIKASWIEQRSVRDIMIFLQSHGIGSAQAARIFRQYGPDAIAVVKSNPYRLCSDVWGIGFKTADAIALSVGVPRESPARARAGLIYLLQSQADEGGHCFCLEADVILHAQELLDIPTETLTEALADEIARGALVRETGHIYLRVLYEAEREVAAGLLRLLNHAVRFPSIAAPRALIWAEGKMGIQLADAQRAALVTAIESKVAVITGGPGVGKTTIIRALTEIFTARRLTVALAAPTGRAAKRMSEATGHEALTIHRLLKYNPNDHAFEYDRDNRLEGDVFILDESSMVDVRLMSQLLEALPDTASLILVGDTDQLPSVGPGNVLRDIIRSRAVPCSTLDTIFRQDTTGLIVRNAHHINKGEMIETAEGASDFYFIDTAESDTILTRLVDLVSRRIPQRFGLSPLEDIQVLTPMRRNSLGAENLNTVLQQALNPNGDTLARGGTLFRANDRVMQIRNNYDKDIYNGDIGFVRSVDATAREIVVTFDGRPVKYEQAELDELVLAYACTIHKSQGSEYPAVVLILHTQHFKLLQRNLLYTGITRGRRLVCIVGSQQAIRMAIRNNLVSERRTGLQDRLRQRG